MARVCGDVKSSMKHKYFKLLKSYVGTTTAVDSSSVISASQIAHSAETSCLQNGVRIREQKVKGLVHAVGEEFSAFPRSRVSVARRILLKGGTKTLLEGSHEGAHRF